MDASPTLLPTDARLPALPPAVPRRRYPIAKVLGWLLLKALGWRYVGGFTNAPRQVLIGWPHTSNWDGIIGLGAAALCGIDVNVLAKRALFRPPGGLDPALVRRDPRGAHAPRRTRGRGHRAV